MNDNLLGTTLPYFLCNPYPLRKKNIGTPNHPKYENNPRIG